MMNKTKIICTLGPSSEDEETLRELIKNGLNVARFNMSHGSYEDHRRRMEIVRKLSKELNKAVGILLDTKGPEVRIRKFKNGSVILKNGQKFTLTTEEIEGDENRVSITYKHLPKDLNKGDIIMVNDGLVKLQVDEVRGTDIITTCLIGGKLSNQKSCNFPNKVLSMPYLSDIDRDDLAFGCEQKIDYVAASFVSNSDNVLEVRNFLDTHGCKDTKIIAKIENASGVENIDAIFGVADGVMIARGDMGVEISYTHLPSIQRMIIDKAKLCGKLVIVATEMLESMIEHPRPTRAETNDVAIAIYEGTGAIMLSGETAAGKYPVQCVKTMAGIARNAEQHINYFQEMKEINYKITTIVDATAYATTAAAQSLHCKLIIAFTESGLTAKLLARFKPGVPIIAATTKQSTYSKLALNWGTIPILIDEINNQSEFDKISLKIAEEHGCKKGDMIVVTSGLPMHKEANSMKILEIE